MTSGRDLVSLEPPFPARPDHRVLAHPQQARRSARADELRAVDQIGSSRNRGLFDIFQAKTMVSSRRGFGRHESPPRNRAENSRLADAQALGRLPRTDQSVQDVCRTNAAL